MSSITTHVLDTSLGRPASGIPVTLESLHPTDGWRQVGSGTTDADGRLRTLLPAGEPLVRGSYRLTFTTGIYFAAQHGGSGFYPEVSVSFLVHDVAQHYHVPLLLSPFGYSTYRGS
jgi:5-hydroxyisourate hydrolase